LSDLILKRLSSQGLSATIATNAIGLLNKMGAIQAQDFAMSKLALSLRLNGLSESYLNTAINDGAIIRTHVMRPTWHLIASENLRWMTDFGASKLKSSMNKRHTDLGLNAKVIDKSFKLINEALSGSNFKTREELVALFNQHHIENINNRAAHIMMLAELEHLVCSGPFVNNKPTYGLISERIGFQKKFSREEALLELFKMFFSTRGPAQLEDFCWWANVNKTDAKFALEHFDNQIVKSQIEDFTYYEFENQTEGKCPELLLIPAFDEWLISYTNRRFSVNEADTTLVLSSNGIFWPVILHKGRAIGTWSRVVKPKKVVVMLKMFNSEVSLNPELIQLAIKTLVNFYEKPVELAVS
jgi:hypothetical protein